MAEDRVSCPLDVSSKILMERFTAFVTTDVLLPLCDYYALPKYLSPLLLQNDFSFPFFLPEQPCRTDHLSLCLAFAQLPSVCRALSSRIRSSQRLTASRHARLPQVAHTISDAFGSRPQPWIVSGAAWNCSHLSRRDRSRSQYDRRESVQKHPSTRSLDEGKVLAVEVFESVLVLTLCARLTAELASCADGKGLVVQDVTIHHDSDFKRRGVAVGSNLSMSLERLVSTAREWSRQGLENDYLIVVLLRAHA
ncbi:hypothetical protein KCU71_g62, partial [Aureobasidium melanogenum]